jgi:hypothetical protein
MAETYRFPYSPGDVVFLKIRTERIPGMVTAIHIYPGTASFMVCWASDGRETCHYALELTPEFIPDYVTAD